MEQRRSQRGRSPESKDQVRSQGIEEAGPSLGSGALTCGRGFPYHCAGRHGWTAAGLSQGSSSGPRRTGICILQSRSGHQRPRCWSRSGKPSGTQGSKFRLTKAGLVDTCPKVAKPLSSCPLFPSLQNNDRVSTFNVLSHLTSQITLSNRNHFIDQESEAQRGEVKQFAQDPTASKLQKQE